MPAAQGYIGRNPADSSTVIARQSFSPTGIQTDFTFAAGYSVGYVDLYLNGARLIEGQDFTATDGSTVGLTTNAVNGDVLEVVAFKAFNATNVTASGGNFTVGQNLTVSGTAEVTGAITATGGVVGDATGLSGTPDITVRHLKATGISTVSDTTQSTTTTSGALIVSGGVGVAKNLFVGGSMNVAGTLTYEDVTNSETPGITTTGGLVVTGLGATFGSGVGIADSIYHIDDSNTAIRFPAADTFTVETAGDERIRFTSGPTIGIGDNNPNSGETLVVARSGSTPTIRVNGASTYEAQLKLQADGTATDTQLIAAKTDGSLAFSRWTGSAYAERLRIDSSGRLLSGLTAAATAVPPSESNASLLQVGATNNPVSIGLVRSDTSISSGNIFGGIHWYGTDTTSNTPTIHASIQAAADGDHAAGDNPTRLTFSTTADSASSVTERVRITSGGRVSIGVNHSSVQSLLNVKGDNDNGNQTVLLRLGNDSSGSGTGAAMVMGAGSGASSQGVTLAGFYDGTGTSFTVGTNASFNGSTTERLRIDKDGKTGININNPGSYNSSGNELVLGNTSSNAGMTIVSNSSNNGHIFFADGTASGAQNRGIIKYEHGNDAMAFNTAENERLRIDSTGRVFIDTQADRPIEMPFGNTLNSAQPGKLVIEDSGAGNLNLIIARENQSNAYGPAISLVKSRGTSDGSYTVVQSGDNLGTVQFGGADGSADRVGAAIVSQVDNTPGSDDMPGRLMFATTADGSGHPTERLRIDSIGTFHFKNGVMLENGIVDTTARTGTQAVNLDNGMVHYFTASATGTWKPNFRGNSSNTLNSLMGTGDVCSPTMIVNKSNTAHYAASVQVDGTDRTIEWLGGAPTAGGGNNTFDVYNYTIIKTANDTFIVFGSVSTYE